MPTFACPTCNKPVEWSAASKWRPFCSERCRLIDLGAWMSGQRSIPGDDAAADDSSGQGPVDRTSSPDDQSPRH
jgi:endogenous inhibitor of DNA gyrase (YacG/DUF329 family)